jgi:hypothetical protein
MRNAILSILFLFVSFNALSQIQTGGHPDGDGIPKEIGEKQFLVLFKKYEKLMIQINEQWSKCSPNSNKKIETLEGLYFEIFWRDFGRTVIATECEIGSEANNMLRNKQVSCFLSQAIKNNLNHFLNQPKVDHFLKFVEGEDSSDQMLEYLKKSASED